MKIYRVVRSHSMYGKGFKDFSTKEEAESWIYSDDAEQDKEEGFYFNIEEIEKEDN